MELLREVCAGNRFACGFFLVSVHAFVPLHPAQHHVGMIDKVAVDGDAVRRLPQMDPIRLYVDGMFPLLKKENIRCDFRSGVGFEGVVRQANRTQQFRPLCDISAHIRGSLVHRAFGRDERDHAARTHLFQRFGKEIIVNQKPVLVERPVRHLVIAKRHIADGDIKKIFAVGLFKARDLDSRIGIELPRHASRDAVQLHAVQPALAHAFRQTAEKVAHAAGGFKHVSVLKAHAVQGFIHRPDNDGAGIVGVQGRAACRRIFLVLQKAFELLIFLLPARVFGVKCLRQTAPADVSGEDFLLVRARLPALRFNLLERLDGGNVERILRLCAAFAQMVIRDAEVLRFVRLGFFALRFLPRQVNNEVVQPNLFLRLLRRWITRHFLCQYEILRFRRHCIRLPVKQFIVSRIFGKHLLKRVPPLHP